MNCVRRHLSDIKGGRLAAACYPARVLTLLISDVPGDMPRDIASGPTVADSSTCTDALAIAKRYKIELPKAAYKFLSAGTTESIKPDDKRLIANQTIIITAPQIALEAAAAVAREAGITPYILSDRMEGEARDIAKAHAAVTKQIIHHGQPFNTPCILISGGETTVTVKGTGRGSRNVEFLLSLAIELDGEPGVFAIAGDTDGVDGAEEIAGAIVTPSTLQRAWSTGINPRASLDANDAHSFFQALGDSVITGPTLTNVNDFRAIFIESARHTNALSKSP
jgi:hydroxypyruvate reductase